MNKIFPAITIGLLLSSAQAELPSVCFDGTYAGGTECDLTIDGEQFGVGLAPDDFFVDEEEFASELKQIYKDLHDKIKQ